MIAPKDARWIDQYERHLRNIERSGPILINEEPAQRAKRKQHLLDNHEAFAAHYFPKVATKKLSRKHLKAINHFERDPQSFLALMAYRGFSKSSVFAIVLIRMVLKGTIKNIGYFSRSADMAKMLLAPIKTAFEMNPAIIADFGDMRTPGAWEDSRFKLKNGAWLRAFGAGQSPRGQKDDEEAIRLDVEIFDDFDDLEVCLNGERLDANWSYVLGACFGAFSTMSGAPRRVAFLNNKIWEDCIAQRAFDKALADKEHGLAMKVNLLDDNGEPSWPEAISKKEAEELIALLEDEADVEYFNNPSLKGKVFTKDMMQYKKLPPLRDYKYLVAYLDGGFKKTKTSDTKALVLVGLINGEYHIRKAYCANASVSEMIGWHYDLMAILDRAKAHCAWWMEEVFLLDLLYKDFDAEAKTRGFAIPIRGDKRKKGDKDLRIAGLAGYFERGNVWFDEELETDGHTKRLVGQFLKFRVGSKTAKDGPDATQGAFDILKDMVFTELPPVIGHRKRNKYQF